jgi:enoyl-[acyl-carrier protein] reductase II
MASVLRTLLCDLLQIEVPVIQGAIGGPWDVSSQMIAAVCNAGGLGSIAATLKTPEQIERQISEVRQMTDKPFAVNHTRRPFNEEAFRATLAAAPAVISFAQGDPGDLVDRAHDAGARFLHQVATVAQARIANRAGADVIIAQGGEAGGFGGSIGTMTLVPQVVDAVAPTPVVAAGGIADGRGLAAALILGAAGVNIGTRFLASVECAVSEEWKSLIVASESEDVVKINFAESVVPPMTEGGWPAIPRSLRTEFIDEWNARLPEVAENAGHLRAELGEAMRSGLAHRLIPLAGQTAGQIAEVLPVAEIMQLLVGQAESALLGWRRDAGSMDV